jgi:uncharacterized coiled-coil protein SlyX
MSSNPSGPQSLEGRLADLEFLFTHLERQLADLSHLMLDQQARLDGLEKALRALGRSQREVNEPPIDELEE